MSEPDASASVLTERLRIAGQDRAMTDYGAANIMDEAAAELDRLARELAKATRKVEFWRDHAKAAEAELARAQAALRDIASCRTRPPADAIEVACRYWAWKK